MRLNRAIALLGVFAVTSLYSNDNAEPIYYEDYLKSLQEEEAPIAVEEQNEAPEIAVEEKSPEDFVYYEDYINSISGQYDQTEEQQVTRTEEREELVADSSYGRMTQTSTQNNKSSNVDMELLSEAFGNFLGKNLRNSGIDFDIESLVDGIRNGINDKPSPLTESEYESMMVAVQQQAFEKLSSNNLHKANAFMAENAQNPKVVAVVPGKLHYLVLKDGKGETVQTENTPLINYTGKFLDGTVFSSSEETGGPITIPLSHTIPGFQKGISGMHEGEKRRLFIHPDQGYGATAGHLPPNSLLVFDIEVVEAHHEEDEVDDLDDSDVEPADEDVDNSDVEHEEQDRFQQ
jgi:peptidylprolyl isomerase